MPLRTPRLTFAGFSTTPVPLTRPYSHVLPEVINYIMRLDPLSTGTNGEFEDILKVAVAAMVDVTIVGAPEPLLHRVERDEEDTQPIVGTLWTVSIPGATLAVRRDLEHLYFEYIPGDIQHRVMCEYSVYDDHPENLDEVVEHTIIAPEALSVNFSTTYDMVSLCNVLRAFLNHTVYVGIHGDEATDYLEGTGSELCHMFLLRRALHATGVDYRAEKIKMDDVDHIVNEINNGAYSAHDGFPFMEMTVDDSTNDDNQSVKTHWPMRTAWRIWSIKIAQFVTATLVAHTLPGDTDEHSTVAFGGLIFDGDYACWYTPLVNPYRGRADRVATQLDMLALLHVLASCEDEHVRDALERNVNFLDRVGHKEADWIDGFPWGVVNLVHERALENCRAENSPRTRDLTQLMERVDEIVRSMANPDTASKDGEDME